MFPTKLVLVFTSPCTEGWRGSWRSWGNCGATIQKSQFMSCRTADALISVLCASQRGRAEEKSGYRPCKGRFGAVVDVFTYLEVHAPRHLQRRPRCEAPSPAPTREISRSPTPRLEVIRTPISLDKLCLVKCWRRHLGGVPRAVFCFWVGPTPSIAKAKATPRAMRFNILRQRCLSWCFSASFSGTGWECWRSLNFFSSKRSCLMLRKTRYTVEPTWPTASSFYFFSFKVDI